MAKLQWDVKGFTIDGQPEYLVSGEFHYFRVPHEDWARRMRLFKEAGGNCIATYVPWVIHEKKEGEIVFGDEPNRDLKAFLETARAEGLMVVLRPGPYQYSELLNDGLPTWLLEDYPEVLARTHTGEPFRESSISYLHPTFLEKARKYYSAFADVARPYLAENGGPVCMLQVDNELTGIHIWFGSLDFNRDTMGFGREDGRYPTWLCQNYASVAEMNAAYGTDFDSFAAVTPPENPNGSSATERRRMRDYSRFYLGTIAEFAELLKNWLREDGLTGPICHNSANPNMNSLFLETVERMGNDFLLGSDHYYTLGPDWPQNSPTPQYMLRMFYSCEMLRAMGMPPTVFELPGGTPSDCPPILPEDLLACYRLNTAVGMKGLNYYVYTGGPNYPGTGVTCDIYDYNAHVSADGSLKDTYYAMKEYGLFLRENGWMQRADRVTSVQIGFDWEQTRLQELAVPGTLFDHSAAWDMTQKGLLFSLMAGSYAPEMKPITGPLDLNKPLLIAASSCMSLEAQQAVIRFVEAGGQLLIAPVIPEMDEDGKPATALKDFLGFGEVRKIAHPGRCLHVEGVENVFSIKRLFTADLPADAQPFAWDERSGDAVAAQIKRGKGQVIWLGGAFHFNLFCQARLMENLVARLGAQPTVESSNRNVYTTLWTDGERRMLFVMNPYSSAQKTNIRVREGDSWRDLGEIPLKYMEIYSTEL